MAFFIALLLFTNCCSSYKRAVWGSRTEIRPFPHSNCEFLSIFFFFLISLAQISIHIAICKQKGCIIAKLYKSIIRLCFQSQQPWSSSPSTGKNPHPIKLSEWNSSQCHMPTKAAESHMLYVGSSLKVEACWLTDGSPSRSYPRRAFPECASSKSSFVE